jgi:N6-adenosine-specific RNA methylase IME4
MDKVMALPVGELALPDCALYLWVTGPMHFQLQSLIPAWGFEYSGYAFSWIKTARSGAPLIGCGYTTRHNVELCLLARRGHPKRLHADVPEAILEPRRESMRKPDCIYPRIERLYPGPHCELFARCTRKDWDSWGDEVGRFGEVIAQWISRTEDVLAAK